MAILRLKMPRALQNFRVLALAVLLRRHDLVTQLLSTAELGVGRGSRGHTY